MSYIFNGIVHMYIFLEKQSSLLKLLFMPSYTSFNILSHSKWGVTDLWEILHHSDIIHFYKKELLKSKLWKLKIKNECPQKNWQFLKDKSGLRSLRGSDTFSDSAVSNNFINDYIYINNRNSNILG